MSTSLSAHDIERLVRGLAASGSVAEADIEVSGARLRVVLDSPPTQSAAPAGRVDAAPFARSPGVGRLRLRHPSGDGFAPLPGAAVEAGAILAFLEAGGRLHPVVAPRAGRLGPALEADGAAVDYDRPLFEIQ